MTSIFTADTSSQTTGGFNVTKTYQTKDTPNIKFYSRSGIYNSADNVIKFFTNYTDALTIDANQKVICDGSLITNLTYTNIPARPTLATVATSGLYNDLSGRPTLATVATSGLYNDLSGRPSLATVATSGLYNDLSGRPTLATVATSGLYNDLSGKPDIFTKTETSNNFTTLTQSNNLFNLNKWISLDSNLYNLDCNIGIGTAIPNYKLDVKGTISSTDYKFNNNSLFANSPANAPTFTNGTQTSINATDYYISYTTNGTLTLPINTTCDCLVVGAGGRGGAGNYSGGGGAGEVVYYTSLSLLSGIYNIEVGIDSATVANRISKLKLGTTEIITAQGGGDGGYYSTSLSTDRRYPPKLYNSITTIVTSTLNGQSAQYQYMTLDTTGITYGSGTYYLWCSTALTTAYFPAKCFDYVQVTTGGEYAGLGSLYSTTSPFAYTGTSYLVESAYKGDWVCIKLPVGVALTSYSIVAVQSTTGRTKNPKNFRLYASNNGTSWITLQTITNATYTSDIYTNTGLSANTTPYLYYAIVVNSITGNGGQLQIAEWIINGKEYLINYIGALSGASGGGGSGGSENYFNTNQTGASSGTPFNVTYSKLTAGASGISTNGGNGGSALITGGYTDVITGLTVGIGGNGATSSSTPVTKTNYGYGGDGNGGLGFQGIVILKFSAQFITQFLEWTNWNKLYNMPSLYTTTQTSNIFVTSNILSNTSNFLVNYNNLINLPSIYTRDELSNIFVTSNVLNNTSNILANYNNLYNKPDIFSKNELSNIFVTSNVLSNTSNFLYNRQPDLTNYFNKTETSNIFITSNVLSNTSNKLADYNNLYNKPTVLTVNYWGLNANNDVVNNNSSGNCIISGGTLKVYQTTTATLFIDDGVSAITLKKQNGNQGWLLTNGTGSLALGTSGYRMVIHHSGDILIGNANYTPNAKLHILTSTNNAEIKILLNDLATGYLSTNGCAIIKGTDQHFYLTNYQNNDMVFSTNATERMRISSGGTVTIPTLSSTTGTITTGNITTANITNGVISGYLKLNDGIAIKSGDNFDRIFFYNNGASYYYSQTSHIWNCTTIQTMILNIVGDLYLGPLIPVDGNGKLHLHKSSLAQDVIIRLTDGTSGYTSTDGLVLWKDTNNDSRLWNYENTNLIFGTNNTERVRITNNGNFSIGETGGLCRLNVKATMDDVNSGICINANDDAIAEKYMLKIYPYLAGTNRVGFKFRLINQPNGASVDVMSMDSSTDIFFHYGTIHNSVATNHLSVWNSFTIGTGYWIRSGDYRNRIYFLANGQTSFRAYAGFEFFGSDNPRIVYINDAGYLGLGNNLVPSYRLEVDATNTSIANQGYRYFNYGQALTQGTTYFSDVCAKFGSSIWCTSWIISSCDRRIKTNIEDVDNNKALEIINRIKPRTFEYIDKIEKGNKRVYGFIAQEVSDIIPEAVSDDGKDVIPNIFKSFEIKGDIIITNEDLRDKLNVNDKIQYLLKDKTGKDFCNILEITDSYIKIDKVINDCDKIFIFGKEVNDFQTLSKEHIFTINVSATQELYKIIQQQQEMINDLQKRILALENK